MGPMLFEGNQGKRSILTDLTTAPGREVFRRLVSWADVVVHNSVDKVAERLGATLKQLQAINPDVVVCQFSAFGGTWRQREGWETRSGYDPVLQFTSGMAANYGSLDEPECFSGTSIDIMGGLSTAFSVLLGIWQKRTTGYAGEGRASLARSANFVQLPFMITKDGISQWHEAHGQFTLGEQGWKRIYRCNDGWIYVETTEDRAKVIGELIAGQSKADDEQWAAIFATRHCEHWLTVFHAADVACHQVLTALDIIEKGVRDVSNEEAEETAKDSVEVLCWQQHPSGSPFRAIAPAWVRVGEAHSYKRLHVAPYPGEHTIEILCKLGYSKDEIDELIRVGVSHNYLPMLGGPGVYVYSF